MGQHLPWRGLAGVPQEPQGFRVCFEGLSGAGGLVHSSGSLSPRPVPSRVTGWAEVEAETLPPASAPLSETRSMLTKASACLLIAALLSLWPDVLGGHRAELGHPGVSALGFAHLVPCRVSRMTEQPLSVSPQESRPRGPCGNGARVASRPPLPRAGPGRGCMFSTGGRMGAPFPPHPQGVGAIGCSEGEGVTVASCIPPAGAGASGSALPVPV